MKRYCITTIIATIAFLLMASPAWAAPFTPALNRAYEIANDYWGGPAPLCTSVDTEIVNRGSLNGMGDDIPGLEILGRATVPSEPQGCFLWIDRRLAQPIEFEKACDVMVHEVGHLHGYWHSEDPSNVMYPIVIKTDVCDRMTGIYFDMLDLKERRHRFPSETRRLKRLSDRFWH